LAADRGRWRRTIRLGCQRLEEDRIHVTREQRRTRKGREWHQQHSPPPETLPPYFLVINVEEAVFPKLDYSATQDGTPRRRNNEDESVVLTAKPTTTTT